MKFLKRLGTFALTLVLMTSLVWYTFPKAELAHANIYCGFGVDNGSGVCVGSITTVAGKGVQTFSVPADWNNSSNTIECIGSGGNGSSAGLGGGGGSGAYASSTNISLTPGGTAQYGIGASATTTTATTRVANARATWFNGAASSSASVECDWGKATSSAGGGAAGAVAFSIGTTKVAGAAGGTASASAGGGGAGSAGRFGIGRAGGDGNINGGGGGAGGSNGQLSTVGANSGGSGGGNGGNGTDGTGHGVADSGAATAGKGGGGAGGAQVGATGGAGAIDTSFDSTDGAGGGGGGGGSGAGGGNAGTYGGGGGGEGNAPPKGTGGQGIIWITYTPLANSTTAQVLMGETIGISENNVTTPMTGTMTSKSDGSRYTAFPVAGTLSHLRYARDAAAGGVITVTATIKVNLATTLLACTVASANTSCSDDTDVINVAAGDDVFLNVTRSGASAGSGKSVSAVFTPTTPNDTVFFSTTPNNGTKATTSLPWFGTTVSATEANQIQVFPEGGTLDRFFATTTTALVGSDDLFVFQNSATSTLTCTIPNAGKQCSDTSHQLTIATGDTFSLRLSPYSATGLLAGFGVRFVPTTAGDFDLMYSTGGNNYGTAGSVRYMPVVGSRTANGTVEASTTAIVPAATTFTSVQLLTNVAPGSGKNGTFSLRVNNATSSLTCTLTGTGTGDGKTTKTCTGSVSVVAGDLIDWSTAIDAGGSAGFIRIGLVGIPTPAAPSTVTTPRMMITTGRMVLINGRMVIQ